MTRILLLLIFISWYPFRLVQSSPSFFDFQWDVSQAPYYVKENFSIAANFNLSSTYQCLKHKCPIHLKLIVKNSNRLSMNLWCRLPSILATVSHKHMDELSCVLHKANATTGNYLLSATAQVHTAGRLMAIFSARLPHNPDAGVKWMKEIVVLNASTNEQQSVQQKVFKRKRRQDINADDANSQQPVVVQNDIANNDNFDQMQSTSGNDGTDVNQPIQLNAYTGTSNQGYTADLTCDGSSACPNYPQTDQQGRTICCFLLPQAPDCTTALSSVVYQNGAQNLDDFQVNIATGQSFTASNDLSVFLSAVITTPQCTVILPAGASASNSVQFRLTWTYQSNAANSASPPPSLPPITTMTDGTLPVDVLQVTSAGALVRQTAQYNEWFVCPTSQDDRISLLQSIALLMGTNVDYFRCIYVNNQGIPLKDPTTGQLLVFTSTKDDPTDNPTIVSLPAVHTDCISVQFFPNPGTAIDLGSILLGITIAFQAAPTTDMSALVPQVSDLQGTHQIDIDIAINLSPNDYNNNTIDNTGQTNNPSNTSLMQCTRYQTEVPMSSYDSSIGKYTGTLDIPPQDSQPTILDSINVTGSSTVENPITVVLIDSQGNTLSPSYSLTSGSTFEDGPNVSISRVILQATALQDAAMDSSLHVDIVICPESTAPNAPSPPSVNVIMPSSQTVNQGSNGAGSPSISVVVPNSQNPPPSQPPQAVSTASPDGSPNCQERESTILGTYPPDLSASTKIPPNMSTPPLTSSQIFTVQKLPDHTCFDRILSTDNPFIYDIFISNSDYNNTLDCLFPAGSCSINFIRTKQPKITLLFNAPACLSYFRIPSPSSVSQFSFAMFDENGVQMQLSGAIDNQGTLSSSSGTNPLVQFNQYLCGYGIIIQLLTTSDNAPAMAVTFETGGCFRDLSAITTMMAPSPPQVAVSSFQYQQIPPSAPAPASSNVQPAVFVPSGSIEQQPPPWNRVPSTSMVMPPSQQPVPPPVPLSCINGYQLITLLFGNQCLLDVSTNDSSITPDYTINPGYQGVNFQSNLPVTITYQFNCIVYLKYICIIGAATNVNKFSYLIFDLNGKNIGQGVVNRLTSEQCSPRPLPTAELADKVIITIEETTDGQPPRNIMIDVQGCSLLPSSFVPSQPPSSPTLSPTPSVISSVQSASGNVRIHPTLPLPSSPLPSPSSSSIPLAPPSVPFQTILPVPIQPSFIQPQNIPSVGSMYSPILQTQTPAPLSQNINIPSAQVQFLWPSQVPITPPPAYLLPPINSIAINQAQPGLQTPLQPSSPSVTLSTTTQPPTPLICPNNNQIMQLKFGSPCVSQIITSDPTVLVDNKINPGAQGINFPSNPPVTITIRFNCNIQIMYMCIPGSNSNVLAFTYALKDAYSNLVATGDVKSNGMNQCTPRPLNIVSPATQLVITISQTLDGRPPNRVVLDLQGCFISTIPVIPTQPSAAAVTPSPPFLAPAPPPYIVPPSPPSSELSPVPVPVPIPMQTVPPAPQASSTPPDQTTTTSGMIPSNICPQVSLTSHPSVQLIVFSDGTNVTTALDSDGNGCNLVSTGTTMTVVLRDGTPATFSSVGVTSSNVNQIDVALFDGTSNRPLIQSPQGTMRSPLTLNPTVQNLPDNPAATLAVTFLSTSDGQPPRNVKLMVYACFPTVTEISTAPPQSLSPLQYSLPTNTFNQQTYPYIQPYPSPSNICIDPTQPAQVTSIANTPLPIEYYSSNQCVCICQPGTIIPTSSGVIQYYPSIQQMNSGITPGQSRQKRQTILTKSNN